jgi:hypothetical protein
MYNKLMYDCITQAIARTTEKPNRIFLEAASKAWAAIFEGGSASSSATSSSSQQSVQQQGGQSPQLNTVNVKPVQQPQPQEQPAVKANNVLPSDTPQQPQKPDIPHIKQTGTPADKTAVAQYNPLNPKERNAVSSTSGTNSSSNSGNKITAEHPHVAAMPVRTYEAPAETTRVNSIINNKSLSIEQKRKILEEHMDDYLKTLSPEERSEFDNKTKMDMIDYGLLATIPFVPSVVPKFAKYNTGGKKGVAAVAALKVADKIKDQIISPTLKEGITRCLNSEGVKSIPQDIKQFPIEMENGTRKIMNCNPKIPYVDY